MPEKDVLRQIQELFCLRVFVVSSDPRSSWRVKWSIECFLLVLCKILGSFQVHDLIFTKILVLDGIVWFIIGSVCRLFCSC